MNFRKANTIKILQRHIIKLLLILLFYCNMQVVKAELPLDSILNALNIELDNRNFHYEKKEERLKTLKIQFQQQDDTRLKFDLCNRLYQEYITYQYDSAYHYAKKGLEIARLLNDERLEAVSHISLMKCYISSGLYKEAYQLSLTIPVNSLPDADKINYYNNCMGLYENLYHYTQGTDFEIRYKEMACLYTDSALLYLKPGTYDYDFSTNFIFAARTSDKREILNRYEKMLRSTNMTQHNHAIISSILGRDYKDIDREKAIYYSALSCIYDIRAAIRETTSKKTTGEYLYDKGDLIFASKCIRIALEDANFYNSRQRQVEINSILPIIEKERIDFVENQKNELSNYLLAVCSLVVLLLISVLIIFRQIKKLNKARQSIQKQYSEISSINQKLEESYTRLEEINANLGISKKELEESNEIKDMYIIQSLYGKSEYIEIFENMLKKVDRKLATRQYDDLRTLYKEINIKAERENMYSSFDKTFLLLFPNFINEYNKLFAEEDHVSLDENDSLSPELRIFALIRLGITESERIAKFLNLSVKTVYSYKGKVKTKAIIPKEEFEYRIMRIRKESVSNIDQTD